MRHISTIELAKLRAFIKGESIEELDVLRENIVHAVQRANASMEGKNEESFVSSCFELWDALSCAPHPYRLPHMYAGSSFQAILLYVFRTMYALETVQVRLGAGGNMVLDGVKGVGKTTILHVAGVIAACLTPTVVPVYWIYDSTNDNLSTVSTYRIAQAALDAFNGDPSSRGNLFSTAVYNTSACDSAPDIKFLFLLDEFTNLYDYGTKGSNVISEYLHLARRGNVFFILASSRINVGKYIFPHGDEHASKARCPKLNCELFSIQEVHPIRNIPDFIAYWQACFNETIDVDTAKRHFSLTGGVGRFILNFHQRGSSKSCQLIGMSVFHDDPSLFHLACNLLVRPVSTVSVRQSTKMGDLDKWIDQLLLYNDGTSVHWNECPLSRRHFVSISGSTNPFTKLIFSTISALALMEALPAIVA